MELWYRTNRLLHRDYEEEREEGRDSVEADRRVNLTNPGAERGVSGMRWSMVSMAPLFCL